jgi:hypothetical protein
MVRSKKRYLLIALPDEAAETSAKLGRVLERNYGKVTLIPVGGSPRHLIVRTNPLVATQMREDLGSVKIGVGNVETVLTSGCIGKLKRLARQREASAVAKVHE